MDYQKYVKARDATWKILIDQEITALPVPITAICRRMGVFVGYDDSLIQSDNDGYSAITTKGAKIAIDPSCTIARRRFTVAHELGHIVLGHVGKYKLVNREPSSDDNPIEQEANVFASRLLAPACVLWGCKVKSSDQIAKLCSISRQAAEYRFERYALLLKRNCFLASSLERQVYNQFLPFIQDHQQDASF